MRTKTNNKPNTQSKLARILGTTRQNIAHHVRAGKAPKSLDDVEAWQSYLAMVGRAGTVPKEMREAMAKEKLGILRAVRREKERANRIKDGEVLDHALVRLCITDVIHNIFYGELDRMAYEFPTTLTGRTSMEIHEEVLKQTEATKRVLRDRLEAWKAMGPKSKEKGR